MNAPRFPDLQARRTAATRFDCNLAVTAGAGTGKTSLLVERFLNLVLSGNAALSEVTAITFTEKAATEMKRRVAAALEAVAAGNPEAFPGEAARSVAWLTGEAGLGAEDLSTRAQRCLEDLETGFIGTIHSFCSDMLRRHPLAADIPPEFGVDDGITQHAAFDEMWLEFLTREFGTPTREGLWRKVLAVFSEEEIEEAARQLVLCPPACDLLAREGYRPLAAGKYFGEKLTALRIELERDLKEVLEFKGRSKMPEFLESLLRVLDLYRTSGSAGLGELDPDTLPFAGFWDKGVPKAGSKVPRKEEIESTAKEARKLFEELRRVEEEVVTDLLEALGPFARKFRTRVHVEGMLSYDDLLLLARNLLADRPDIRTQEAARNRFMLVDEFQDTDPLQYEILFLLARGKEEDTLEPGRLFVVGDPKQSIYRFRGADISAYLEARDRIMEASPEVSLTTNFRSLPGILTAVNRLFQDWMKPRTEEERRVEPDYEALNPPEEVSGGEPCVEIWSIPTPEESLVEDRRAEEARQIASAIRSWKDQDEHGFGEVAVLFRSLIDIPIYVRALRDAGIDFVVDGGKAFSERQEVVEAFALLRALANPADPVAALAVLRSPLGGAADPEILAYAREKGRFSWLGAKSPALETFPGIERTFDFLRYWNKERLRTPLDRWVLRILTESEFLLLAASHFEGAQRVANVRKLAEMIATLIRERGLTLEQAVDSLEEQFNREREEGESPLADEAVNAVRILSMHKSKGLEYPVVILPDLARAKPGPRLETRIRMLRTGSESFIAVEIKGRDRLRNTAAARWIQEEKLHEAAEDKRILYVAATRAKKLLVLVNAVRKPTRNAWLEALAEWGYRITPGEASPFPEEGVLADLVRHRLMAAPAVDGGEDKPPPPDLVTRVLAFGEAGGKAKGFKAVRFRHPSEDDHAKALAALSSSEEEDAPRPRDRELARAAGAAVHRLLETWDFQKEADLREPAARVSRMSASEYGQDPAAVEAEVGIILDGFLSSSLPRRLSQAVILGREVPILFRDAGGAVVYGYADLVYRKDGAFHVADYKTDDHPSAGKAEIYRDQLQDYGTALQRAWNLDTPPVLEVLFLRTGECVRLSSDPAGS